MSFPKQLEKQMKKMRSFVRFSVSFLSYGHWIVKNYALSAIAS